MLKLKVYPGSVITLGVALVMFFAIFRICDISVPTANGIPVSVKKLNGIYAVKGTNKIDGVSYVFVQPVKIRTGNLTTKNSGKLMAVDWPITNPPEYVFFDGKGNWMKHPLSDLPTGATNALPVIPAAAETTNVPQD